MSLLSDFFLLPDLISFSVEITSPPSTPFHATVCFCFLTHHLFSLHISGFIFDSFCCSSAEQTYGGQREKKQLKSMLTSFEDPFEGAAWILLCREKSGGDSLSASVKGREQEAVSGAGHVVAV